MSASTRVDSSLKWGNSGQPSNDTWQPVLSVTFSSLRRIGSLPRTPSALDNGPPLSGLQRSP